MDTSLRDTRLRRREGYDADSVHISTSVQQTGQRYLRAGFGGLSSFA
jgi:hypothetical protein